MNLLKQLEERLRRKAEESNPHEGKLEREMHYVKQEVYGELADMLDELRQEMKEEL